MDSLDAVSEMTPKTALLVLEAFARTYRMHGSRLVDRHGNEAPCYTLGLVVQAQAVLA